eukprot:Trichotokara_eunicae@DN6273_c0_g1_i10.p1
MFPYTGPAPAHEIETARKRIEVEIAQNKVVMYQKGHCPYCHIAIDAFKEIGVEFLNVEISRRKDMNAIQDVMIALTGGRTVPRVFIGGKFIGGGNETVALLKSGKLKEMCLAAGAL